MEMLPIVRPMIRYQFDNAVVQFGIFIENRLNELDDKGRAKYKSDEIFLSKKDRIKKSPSLKDILKGMFS